MLFRKGKTMKSGKYLRVPVIAVIIISLILGTTSFAAAADKPKLSAQQLSIRAGSTSELRVKNTDKKIRWSTSDKKIVTVKSAGKTKAKVSAKKERDLRYYGKDFKEMHIKMQG